MDDSSNNDNDIENYFRRVDDPKAINADDFIDRFERFGFYWFKSSLTSNNNNNNNLPKSKDILNFIQEYSTECKKKWSVENTGNAKDEHMLMNPSNLSTILLEEEKEGSTSPLPSSFYVSTIVHRQDEKAYNTLQNILPSLDSVFDDLQESNSSSSGSGGGSWIFLGYSDNDNNDNTKKRKRRRNMLGRAEHVDEVIHSGTYHIQICGSKMWYVRPHPELYCGEDIPDLSTLPGAEQSDSTKSWRLVLNVQEGDVFVLNTKIWFHYTEIPPSGWSISVANDFFLPLPCPRDVAKGDVIFEDEEDIPEEIPRSNDPNCVLGEIEESGGAEDSEDDDDNDGGSGKIVLIAIKDISQGELLSIAEDVEGEGLGNADETVDPRAVANENWEKGQIILKGDEIPNELPRSLNPNCELFDDGTAMSLRAIEDISAGSVFCILPSDDEEYEEVEVDLNTGQLRRDS